MELRPYQNDAIDGLRTGFKSGHIRQILSASTGSGKSIIMLEMIRASAAKGIRSIFIVERRKLVEQFSHHLSFNGISHGVLMSGHSMFRMSELVQVVSAQTLERMDEWPAFDLMFVDEVHANLRAGSVIKIMNSRPSLKVVGATATPFNKRLGSYFSNVVSAPPMKELVEMGNLLPFRAFMATETVTDGLALNSIGEWEQEGLQARGIEIVGDVVADYQRLSHEIYQRKSKAICFSAGIAHGAALAKRFNESGISAIQLASGVDNNFRDEVFREFSKSDSSIDVLISAEMLTRGFDQPDIEHVILAKPIKKSFSNFVQMIGRGARPHGDQKFCIVQDHGYNFLRFQNEWSDFYEQGVKTLHSDADYKTKKEPTKKEKEASKCPKCAALWQRGSDICSHCGYVRSHRSSVNALAGECTEFSIEGKKEKWSIDYKKQWYQGMIGLLVHRGKTAGRAYHLYKEKFGCYPVNGWDGAAPWTTEIENYLQRANIAYAKKAAK